MQILKHKEPNDDIAMEGMVVIGHEMILGMFLTIRSMMELAVERRQPSGKKRSMCLHSGRSRPARAVTPSAAAWWPTATAGPTSFGSSRRHEHSELGLVQCSAISVGRRGHCRVETGCAPCACVNSFRGFGGFRADRLYAL